MARIKWTTKDQAAALREGWALFNMDTHPEIQKDDDQDRFPDDDSARRHVALFASPLHDKALKALGFAMTMTSRPSNAEAEEEQRGQQLVRVLGLRPIKDAPPSWKLAPRYRTTGGNKTALGLARTVASILAGEYGDD